MHVAVDRKIAQRLLRATFVIIPLILLPWATPSESAAAEPGRRAQLLQPTQVGRAAASPSLGVISHKGSQLLLDGQPFRFAGANEYYLGLDDNLRDQWGEPTYPTHARIDAALDSAVSLGVTMIRSHTLGISVGDPRSVEPALGVWNDAAFDSIDYAVSAAGSRGIHLMVPLTDEWRWYHGGKSTFTGWRGYPNDPDTTHNVANDSAQRSSEAHFYTDPAVVGDFEAYVRHLITHRNPYTGVTYAEDPTIAIWETGNELWDAPPEWTDMIARFIKTIAPRQLVADGSAANGMHVANAAITSSSVDIVGGHFYPRDVAWLERDAAVAAAHGKAYVIGEYDWHGDLTTWLQTIETDHDISGSAFWTLLPHLPDGSPEQHGDGYALWAPGVDDETRAAVTALTAHARRMLS